jgi:hypothetical protein
MQINNVQCFEKDRKIERQKDRKTGMKYCSLVFRVLVPGGYKEMSSIFADQ